MFLPRALIAIPYENLKQTTHAHSPPVILLVALEPDALCACRILTTLFKRDYIPHQIVPVAGYGDLLRAGRQHVRPMRTQAGGPGGTVICLGVGGLVDLGEILGLEATDDPNDDPTGGVLVWVLDARRPWNLGNVFNGCPPLEDVTNGVNGTRRKLPPVKYGEIQPHWGPGKGGVIVFDDGDIGDELQTEREAYFKLQDMQGLGDDDGQESDGSSSSSEDEAPASGQFNGRKRKSSDNEDDGSDIGRPRQRRRSDSVSLNCFSSGALLTRA